MNALPSTEARGPDRRGPVSDRASRLARGLGPKTRCREPMRPEARTSSRGAGSRSMIVRARGIFWAQSFPFSCGPAALGSVLSALGWPTVSDRRSEELAIWRESTAVACPGAHPYGLALAAHRRGFEASVQIDGSRPWLWPHIRSQHPAFRLGDYRTVERDLAHRCAEKGISIRREANSPMGMGSGVLLTTAPEPGSAEAAPHWIAIVRARHGLRISDPLVRASRRSSLTLRQWWERSGFEGTRSWVGIWSRGHRSKRTVDARAEPRPPQTVSPESG